MSIKDLINNVKRALGAKKLQFMMDDAGDADPGEVWRPWGETIQKITHGSNPEQMKLELARLSVQTEALHNYLERKYPNNALKGRRVDSGLEVMTSVQANLQ